jgi:hypothetical protein
VLLDARQQCVGGRSLVECRHGIQSQRFFSLTGIT